MIQHALRSTTNMSSFVARIVATIALVALVRAFANSELASTTPYNVARTAPLPTLILVITLITLIV